MIKLYYVVEKELESFDANTGEECTTGRKTVTVYSCGTGMDIEKQFDVEGTNDENSLEMINDYLNDNGMGDTEYDLIQL